MTNTTGEGGDSKLEFELIFDGGSRGNPGTAYGSYRLRQSGQKARKPIRLKLGRGTNNEAEYLTLIQALQDLLSEFSQSEINPNTVDLIVVGDSQLVIHQLQGKWKAKDARMRALRDQVLELGNRFGSVRFRHHDRWRSVSALGH
jgi:ribonuclease HI